MRACTRRTAIATDGRLALPCDREELEEAIDVVPQGAAEVAERRGSSRSTTLDALLLDGGFGS